MSKDKEVKVVSVDEVETEEIEEVKEEPVEEEVWKKARVIVELLNVRNSYGGDVIFVLPENSIVDVDLIDGPWTRIRFEDESKGLEIVGCVMTQYLEFFKG